MEARDGQPIDGWLIGRLRRRPERVEPSVVEQLLTAPESLSLDMRMEAMEQAVVDLRTRMQAAEAELRRLAAHPAEPGHTLFVPTAEGYEIVESEGTPPAVGERIVIDERAYVVEGSRRSPFPRDSRPCLQLAGAL
jgi:hypothetical protein